MNLYTDFDYLCSEPYPLPGIGILRNVTLRDIRRVTFNRFFSYLHYCSITSGDVLKRFPCEETDNLSSGSGQFNLYRLLTATQPEILLEFIDFFLLNPVEYHETDSSFHIFMENLTTDSSQSMKEIGKIDESNFDIFRNEILKSLGLKQIRTKKPKYKTERARLLAEKIEKAKSQMKFTSRADENMSLENMIKKYCTHNKVGINILNVWDMTFYQFHAMFSEYCSGRECDFNDMMAANTFSFKESKNYNPVLWLQKLHKNNQ